MRTPTSRNIIGSVIGDKYRVLDRIGQGGMGQVFEAEHMALGRQVAVKVLNWVHLGDTVAETRFYREARAAGTIGHPNICEVYDVGQLADGAPYMVMERLHGRTLADRIDQEGALPVDDVVGIVTQVLSALVAAHRKNIIHRDIKPGNIFLAERIGVAPLVKILDFGISKQMSGEEWSIVTSVGKVIGTPYYMAPEQLRGQPIDHRVDLYATGVVLYEALAGQRPYLGANYHALVTNILKSEPRELHQLRPDMPFSLLPVVARAMARLPNERFYDGTEFLRAVSRARSEERAPRVTRERRPVEGVDIPIDVTDEELELIEEVPPPRRRRSSQPVDEDGPTFDESVPDDNDTVVDQTNPLKFDMAWHLTEEWEDWTIRTSPNARLRPPPEDFDPDELEDIRIESNRPPPPQKARAKGRRSDHRSGARPVPQSGTGAPASETPGEVQASGTRPRPDRYDDPDLDTQRTTLPHPYHDMSDEGPTVPDAEGGRKRRR